MHIAIWMDIMDVAGGIETSSILLASELVKRKIGVSLLTAFPLKNSIWKLILDKYNIPSINVLSHEELNELDLSWVYVDKSTDIRWKHYCEMASEIATGVKRVLQKVSADIIHISGISEVGLAIAEEIKGLNIPITGNFFSDPINWPSNPKSIHKKINTFDALILPMHLLANRFRNNFKNYYGKLFVIPHFVPAGCPEILFPRKEKHINIGCISILAPEKGLDYLLAALSILTSEFNITNIKLNIYGMGGEYERLKDIACMLEVRDFVNFYGVFRPIIDIPFVMSKNDFFILPSIMESFGVALIEAMAWGKITIASNVGIAPEIYVGALSKFLFRRAHVEEMAEKLAMVIKMPHSERKIYESKFFKIFMKNFTPQRVVPRYIQAYKEIKQYSNKSL